MGRITEEIKGQRDELIAKMLSEGYSNVKEISGKLADHPLFSASKNKDVVYQYVWRVIRQKQNQNGAGMAAQPKTCRSQSHFEQIVNRVSLRLPVGVADQVARLIRVFRVEWSLLEQEALKAKQLEVKVRELERHCCPDASGELREKNERLKEQIAFLERRVEALSNLTTPRRIDDRHLAVSGG